MGADELNSREAELADVFEQYYERVARYAYVHVGDRMAAEDIAGETFLKALKALSSYREKGLPMSAWVFRIAHNLVVDYLRQKDRRRSVPLDGLEILVDGGPHETAESRLELERVKQAMRRLSPAEQEVVRLRFMAELSSKEVSAVMHKSDGAVRQMQSTAVAKLRRLLAE